ncbi:MAG: helix-turn-helix domain-containing protein [Pseudomonadota bacterium]|nr:helix-turn-helix domain-containing protein [Pseudomonadota bacterium]
MKASNPPQPTRRARLQIQDIRSPLTRVGVTLAAGTAQLVLLHGGQVELRGGGLPEREEIDGPRLLWLPDGNGGELSIAGGTRATILSIPELEVMNALPATPLGERMRKTFAQDLSAPLERDGQVAQLVQGLSREYGLTEPGAELSAQYYLSLILIHIWRQVRTDMVAHGHSPQGLVERFMALASQRMREHLRVSDYATALNVTRDRLGTAVRRATGKSPQGYLHQLLIREASELLSNTGMPVSQVAYRLGFHDPAYFTRFFIRHRGESPAKFRRTARIRRLEGDKSYAAWP